jgi:Cytochrome C'
MSTRTRVGAVVGAVAVLGLLFVIARSGSAGDEKVLAGKILKIADLVEKGDAAGAQKAAAALAKDTELEDVMHLFKPRKKKGLGVGDKPGSITPDGIEQQYIKLGRDELSQGQAAKEASALARMGYVTAAIADFAMHKPNDKVKSAQDKQDWKKWTTEMRETSVAFAEAAKSKSSAAVHKAAEKVNASCNSCHSKFRE